MHAVNSRVHAQSTGFMGSEEVFSFSLDVSVKRRVEIALAVL